MSRRTEKINKHIQRTLGEILQQEAEVPANVLVTISRVETTADLTSANVWLYINPIEQATKVLAALKAQLYQLQGSLNRKLILKPLPRIRLEVDYGAQHAEQIERRLNQLEN